MTDYDIVVVGAGIIGSASAYYLAKQGKRTLLLEQFQLPHTRGSSHGQSRIITKAYREHHYVDIVKEAYPMWEMIETEAKTKLMRPNEMLFFGEDNSPHMIKIRKLFQYAQSDYEILSPYELQERFPMLNFVKSHGGIIDKEAGVLHADKCVSTIQGLFLQSGGRIHDRERVTKIEPGQIIKIQTNRGQYSCKSLILTLGPWATKLLNPLGLDLPIKTLGVTVSYWKKNGNENPYTIGNFPSFIATHGGTDENGQPVYMYGQAADEYPDHVKIGFDSGQNIDPDSRDAHPEETHDIEAMKVFVQSHFPGLEDFPSIIERCILSVTPNREVFLDCHPLWKNIIIGAGFSGHGFNMAPVFGKILGQLATGIKPEHDISALKIKHSNLKSNL